MRYQFRSLVPFILLGGTLVSAQHRGAGGAAPAGGGHAALGSMSRPGSSGSSVAGQSHQRPAYPNPPNQGGGGRQFGPPPSHRYGNGPRVYGYPVIVGGYYGVPLYGYDSFGQSYYNDSQQQQQQPPNVLYNPGYQQDYANPQFRNYDDVPLPPPGPMYAQQQQQRDPSPTIYLIALQDGSVLQALGYWVQGDTLCYIARDANPNRISMDRVDRELSTKLNVERGLQFKL